MRGKKPAPKQKILPDPKYHNITVAKLINYVMRKGKKFVAQKIVYNAFDIMAKKANDDPVKIFDTAIKNVSPAMEVRSTRIGGANYQIPYPVRGNRKLILALRWIIEAAHGKKGKPMSEKLAEEFLLAADSQGTAIKKRQDTERMADANRAFAHFARIR